MIEKIEIISRLIKQEIQKEIKRFNIKPKHQRQLEYQELIDSILSILDNPLLLSKKFIIAIKSKKLKKFKKKISRVEKIHPITTGRQKDGKTKKGKERRKENRKEQGKR